MTNESASYYQTIKNFLTYSLSAILLRSLTAVTSLLALRIIEPAHIGVLALINTFVAIAPLAFNLGLRQAFWLEYFHKTSIQRKILFNHAVAAYLCIAIPLLTLGIFNAPLINHYLFFGQANNWLIIIALVYCFVQFFSELFLQILRNQMRALLLACIQLGAATITMLTFIYLVFYANWGIVGILFANTLGITCIAIIGFWLYLHNHIYVHVTRANFVANTTYLLRLGFPFIPSMVLIWLLTASNRWILAYMGTLQQLGIYAVADVAGQAFNLCILTPLNAAYIPYMLQQYTSHPTDILALEKKNIRTMQWAMIGASALITVGTAIAFMVAPYVLPALYQQAVRYVWFIGMANVLLMGTCFSSCIIFLHKKTWWLLAMNGITAAANICFNFLLIPYLGIYGCVIASIFAYALFFYLNWLARKRLLVHYFL